MQAHVQYQSCKESEGNQELRSDTHPACEGFSFHASCIGRGDIGPHLLEGRVPEPRVERRRGKARVKAAREAGGYCLGWLAAWA